MYLYIDQLRIWEQAKYILVQMYEWHQYWFLILDAGILKYPLDIRSRTGLNPNETNSRGQLKSKSRWIYSFFRNVQKQWGWELSYDTKNVRKLTSCLSKKSKLPWCQASKNWHNYNEKQGKMQNRFIFKRTRKKKINLITPDCTYSLFELGDTPNMCIELPPWPRPHPRWVFCLYEQGFAKWLPSWIPLSTVIQETMRYQHHYTRQTTRKEQYCEK